MDSISEVFIDDITGNEESNKSNELNYRQCLLKEKIDPNGRKRQICEKRNDDPASILSLKRQKAALDKKVGFISLFITFNCSN